MMYQNEYILVAPLLILRSKFGNGESMIVDLWWAPHLFVKEEKYASHLPIVCGFSGEWIEQ